MLIEDVPAGPAKALLRQVAAVTRAAFLGAEPVPGLPTADGAFETPESVAADLEAGAWMAVAHRGDGVVRGCVRAFTAPSGAWVVRRLAVDPGMRGSGLSRTIMRYLESRAAAQGAREVRLDAVVERGNPPFYAGLGYRTVGHMPNPDKPLSEVAMLRDLTAPARRFGYPWEGEDCPGSYPTLVTWHSDGVRTLARVHCAAPDALSVCAAPLDGLRFAGADGGQAEVPWRERVFDVPPEMLPEFRMPRSVHPELLALWRPRPKIPQFARQ